MEHKDERTDLLGEHVPLELRQIFHCPNVVAPASALLPTYGLLDVSEGSLTNLRLTLRLLHVLY